MGHTAYYDFQRNVIACECGYDTKEADKMYRHFRSNSPGKFFFTFGSAHRLLNGEPAGNCYTTITAENETVARKKMHEVYGGAWAFVYLTAEEAGVERFGLKFVEVGI